MTILPSEADVLVAVHAAATHARSRVTGPLPPIRSTEFIDADPDMQVAALMAAATAWVLEDPHRARRAELRAVADDVHGGNRDYWRRVCHNHVPHEVLAARRAAPGPLAQKEVAA